MHIHSIDVYTRGDHLCGLEIAYLVDGDVLKYVIHHKVHHEKTRANANAQKAGFSLLKKKDSTAEI